MGYRSDGGYWFKQRGEGKDADNVDAAQERKTVGEVVATFMLEHGDTWERVKDEVVIADDMVSLEFSGRKWDDTFDDVRAHEAFRDYCAEHGLKGIWCRVGEDEGDIEVSTYNSFCWSFGKRPVTVLEEL